MVRHRRLVRHRRRRGGVGSRDRRGPVL